MSPSLHSGQIVVIRRVGASSELARGSVVVLQVNGKTYVKRVYARGGEAIWGIDADSVEGSPDWIVRAEDVDRVGALTREHTGLGRLVRITVPEDHVFVLGDACSRSYDSRHFGFVPLDAIVGRVVRPAPSAAPKGGSTCSPPGADSQVHELTLAHWPD
jgi:signal peptidase I